MQRPILFLLATCALTAGCASHSHPAEPSREKLVLVRDGKFLWKPTYTGAIRLISHGDKWLNAGNRAKVWLAFDTCDRPVVTLPFSGAMTIAPGRFLVCSLGEPGDTVPVQWEAEGGDQTERPTWTVPAHDAHLVAGSARVEFFPE